MKNKGLEALKHLYDEYILTEYPDSILEDIDEDKEIIEKELKALEIIKEKQVDVRMFIIYDLDNYNKLQKNNYCKLTKAEDDLLKEVLSND